MSGQRNNNSVIMEYKSKSNSNRSWYTLLNLNELRETSWGNTGKHSIKEICSNMRYYYPTPCVRKLSNLLDSSDLRGKKHHLTTAAMQEAIIMVRIIIIVIVTKLKVTIIM